MLHPRFTPFLAAAMVAIAACGQDLPTSVPEADLQAGRAGGPPFTISPLFVRPAEGSASIVWGRLRIITGRVPPSPCNDRARGADFSVCGILHNPGGEQLLGGTITIGTDPRTAPVVVSLVFPPSPCTTYIIRGGEAGIGQNPGPPVIQASILTDQGALMGLESNPGPPIGPGRKQNPGPPTTPVCNVGIMLR